MRVSKINLLFVIVILAAAGRAAMAQAITAATAKGPPSRSRPRLQSLAGVLRMNGTRCLKTHFALRAKPKRDRYDRYNPDNRQSFPGPPRILPNWRKFATPMEGGR